MKRHSVGAVALAALLLGLAACGSSEDGQSTSKPAAAEASKTKLTVIAPTAASAVRTNHVVVRGTIVPVGAQVQVMGKSAKVTDGLFRADAPLEMGANKIDVVAIAEGSDPVTTTISVTRGRTSAQLAAARKKRRARAAAARKASAKRRAAKAKEKAAAEAKSPDCIVVPNVVGKNHQSGQNRMQAVGLFLLDEEDATGEGRLLLHDRNWVDVAQEPAAGECVSPDTTVLLSAKKIGE